MASRPAPRRMTVLASRALTPAMWRVTLGGEGMRDYPSGQDGGYVKLMLAPEAGKAKPTVRTYTIRHQRTGEMDVDFALHGSGSAGGPATAWAMQVTGGEAIELGGPGPAKPLREGFDCYLLAGDMTALSAISVNLEQLPRNATGLAVIEVQSEADSQAIDAPAGVQIRWVINPLPGTQPDLLADAIRAADWPQGSVFAWVSCEFSAMRQLREYLRTERSLGSGELYISSYWKCGIGEDDHKRVKREDAGSVEALAG